MSGKRRVLSAGLKAKVALAAALESFRFIGIEKERPYFDIAQRRIETEYALAV